MTTSRLTEHHTAGGMSRQLPYLSELQPEMFIEVSPELAAERGLAHLGWATVVTSRAAIEARVLVTDRLAPLRVGAGYSTRSGCRTTGAASGLVTGDSANDLFGVAVDPNVLIQESKVATCDVGPGRRPRGRAARRPRRWLPGPRRRRPRRPGRMSRRSAPAARAHLEGARDPSLAGPDNGNGADDATGGGLTAGRQAGSPGRRRMPLEHSLFGPLADVAANAGHTEHPPRVGFFTDTSVCIGCKACEVACKEWNLVPDDGFNLLGMSYDNTGMLGANSWRHVAFIEQPVPAGRRQTPFENLPTGPSGSQAAASTAAEGLNRLPERGAELGDRAVDLGMPSFELPGAGAAGREPAGLPLADGVGRVQALHARRLPRRLPHGRAVPHRVRHGRRPAGRVQRVRVLREGCPYGVIERREGDGRAWKCTLCYDRLHGGLEPACAKACPTDSIQFGELDVLRETAKQRVEQLHADGVPEARLYGESPDDGVGGQRRRSSCCSTSPRSTACRRTRSSRRATCPDVTRSPQSRRAALVGAFVTVFSEGRRR